MASNKNRLQDPVARFSFTTFFFGIPKIKTKSDRCDRGIATYYFFIFLSIFSNKKIANVINPLSHLSLLHRFFSKDSGKLEKHNRLFQISRHVLKKPKISLVSY